MKIILTISTMILVAAAVGLFVPGVVAAEEPTEAFAPVGAEALVYARPFTLETPYQFLWCKEKPEITRGTVIVVKIADKELIRPRQSAMAVLFANGRTVEVANVGYRSGHLVGFVPGKIDLRRTRFYHGTPELPERVDTAHGKGELAGAIKAGIKPFSQESVEKALARGGALLKAKDINVVYSQVIAELIERYSPLEKDRAEGYRLWKSE